jgi:hypothetical protein
MYREIEGARSSGMTVMTMTMAVVMVTTTTMRWSQSSS